VVDQVTSKLLNMKRSHKRTFVMFFDVGLCLFTVWISYYLRLGYFVALRELELYVVTTSITLIIPILHIFGLYNIVYRYFGTITFISIVKAMTVYSVLFASIFTVVSFVGIPRTIGLIQPVLLLIAISFSRVLVRFWINLEMIVGSTEGGAAARRVMIYGTGEAGRQLALSLTEAPNIKMCGFLDEDPSLHKQDISGCAVYNPSDILSLSNRFQLTDVLITLSMVSRKRRNTIMTQMQTANVAVRAVPNLSDLARGNIKVSELRELDIEDLLGREPVVPNPQFFSVNIEEKCVMVTGAGGSIGSELCRQIIQQKPSRLLLIEVSEFALYSVYSELLRLQADTTEVIPLLASVCDDGRMKEIFSAWSIDTIYHAAAYKHVPLVEHNIAEGVKNNIAGTLTTAQMALKFKVKHFVLVSTDKAVKPTSVMGASKRLTEIGLQALASEREFDNEHALRTCFSIVRFGNVLNSSGSVVPQFKRQIQEGGPVTVTHPEITRFFMTIREAAQLVIQAGALAEGGDVFLLDMGESIKIIDLATKMIELTGLTVKNATFDEGDIEIAITGLRPGEKLYEELLISEDAQDTLHPRIMKAKEPYIPWCELEPQLEELQRRVSSNDIVMIHELMQELVSEYKPSTSLVDWVYQANNSQ